MFLMSWGLRIYNYDFNSSVSQLLHFVHICGFIGDEHINIINLAADKAEGYANLGAIGNDDTASLAPLNHEIINFSFLEAGAGNAVGAGDTAYT